MGEILTDHKKSNLEVSSKTYKPILFSTPMVQAILRGKKTQTRRVVKYSKNITDPKIGFSAFTNNDQFEVRGVHENGQYGGSLFKLKYKMGDILWVRETWGLDYFGSSQFWHFKEGLKVPTRDIIYKADDENRDTQFLLDKKWKPSIFMPKDICRIFLKITNIRIQRLNDISGEDALKEGVIVESTWPLSIGDAYRGYAKLWDEIHGSGEWDKNPWVFVYEFERTEGFFDYR